MKAKFRSDICMATIFALFVIIVSWKSGINTYFGMPWGILATSITAAMAAVVGYQLDHAKPRTTLTKRMPMSVGEIYKQNFKEKGIDQDVFEKHWRKIASALQESPEVLRPSDRIGEDLPARGHFDYSNDDLAEYVLQTLGHEFDLRSLKTLDQLVRALCSNDDRRQKE